MEHSPRNLRKGKSKGWHSLFDAISMAMLPLEMRTTYAVLLWSYAHTKLPKIQEVVDHYANSRQFGNGNDKVDQLN